LLFLKITKIYFFLILKFIFQASKNELNTGLSLKANISDVSRTIAEISSSMDGKIGFEDMQVILRDYVQKGDL
jgi:hypothetical protein